MPEPQVQTAPVESQEGKKKQTLLWVLLVVLVLALIGLFCYWYFVQKPKNVESTADEQADNADNGDEDEITWLDYSDDETDVTFKYPEGGVVTGGLDDDEEICKGTRECFEYVITYGELEFTITGITGIGGESVSPGRPYIVISGTQHEGLAREAVDDGDETLVSGDYYQFEQGPLTGVTGVWLSFDIQADEPSELLSSLLTVADSIAASYYGVELNAQYEYGKFYIMDNSTIVSVANDGEEDIVFETGGYEDDESMDVFIASDDFSYLGISTRIGIGPEQYFYILNVEGNELVEIDGDNHWENAGDYPLWMNDHQVISYSPSDNKYYKYDVTALTRTVLTDAEYEQYIE